MKLWLARRPGDEQVAVIIAGRQQPTGIRFGTRQGLTPTPRRVKQRTTIQFANTRVRADGMLDYAGVAIP
jgi:hypothetical protein